VSEYPDDDAVVDELVGAAAVLGRRLLGILERPESEGLPR